MMDSATLRRMETCPNPIFVIGSPRSGTTGLARSLAVHSHLWASEGESQILLDLFGDGRLDRNYLRRTRPPDSSWLEDHGVSQQDFRFFAGLGLNVLFTTISKGRRWIDHTPSYTLMVDQLADMFPGAQFLHILRDGRDVVSSMTNFLSQFPEKEKREMIEREAFSPWATDFREACKTWVAHVRKAQVFAIENRDRALTIRYEQLVIDPVSAFHHILDFLAEQYEDGPASFFASSPLNSSFAQNPAGLSRPERVSDPWTSWSDEEKQIFAEESKDILAEIGYARRDSYTVSPKDPS